MAAENEDVIRRLERAEAELRKVRGSQKRIWLGASVLWLAGAFMMLTHPLESALAVERSLGAARVRAPLVITGRTGRPIAQISDTPAGGGITVFDRQGGVVAALGAGALGGNGGRGLLVLDENGKPVFIGGEGDTPTFGGRGLSVFDNEGKVIGALGTGSRNNNPIRGLAVVDQDGVAVAALGTGRFGTEPGRGLGVIDPAGTLVAGMFVDETGDKGRLAVRNRAGSMLFNAP